MKAPRETARQASAREAREEAQEEAREMMREARTSRAVQVEEAPKEAAPTGPRPPREPASIEEEWANLYYLIDAYLAPKSRSDELLAKLKVQLEAYDKKVRKPA